MRKIIYFVHQSLDGYIEGPNGEFDWPMVGPELSAYGRELDDQVDTILYGRVVWEMMSAFWPQAESMSDDPHDLDYAPRWRAKPKVVVSSTLSQADWNTRVIGGDLVEEVTALKREPGRDVVLMGGQKLAAGLAGAGLLDEYRIVIHPVLLGGGRPLFEGQTGLEGQTGRTALTLVESRSFDSRSVLLRYTVPRPPEE
jgi:dihydrofolate reductase